MESREKDLRVLTIGKRPVKPVPVLTGSGDGRCGTRCRKKNGLAMNADDLREVASNISERGRDPFETELRILDTYWSDHCRHTTHD